MTVRRTATLTLTAALALTLAGCGDETPSQSQTGTVTAEPTTEEPTQEATSTAGPTEEATPTTEATTETPTQEATTSGEVPAPGTAVQVGETVTLHKQAGQEGDQYYGNALVATTVTEVAPFAENIFEQAANAADFAGLTPWVVKVDFEWTTYEGQPNDNMLPRIGAVNSSGGELSPVLTSSWSVGIPGCQLEMPDEKGVGESASNCIVFAVPSGESIGAAVWRGDDSIDGYGTSDGNEYYADPIRWEVP